MLNRLHAMFTAANYAYRICNVFEGVADLGDHLVFRYSLPKHFCVDLVNKLLQLGTITSVCHEPLLPGKIKKCR